MVDIIYVVRDASNLYLNRHTHASQLTSVEYTSTRLYELQSIESAEQITVISFKSFWKLLVTSTYI